MRLKNLIAIAAVCVPVPLLAQSTNNALCGVAADTSIFDTLSGDYKLVHGPGTISMDQHVFPFPQSEPLDAKILVWDGRLHLFEETGLLRLHFSVADSTRSLGQLVPGTDMQETIDQLTAAACPLGNKVLPYLYGEGGWVGADGTNMSTILIMVFSKSADDTVHGWGFMQSNNGEIDMNVQMVLDAI